MAAALLSIGGGALSLALFSHVDTVDGPIAAGTIELGVGPTSSLLTFAGMVPGDSVQGVLTVRNDGTGALRYAMTVDATDADGKHLADLLLFSVERRTGCGGAVLEVLFAGPIGTAAFGNPQAGSQSGDRPIDPGASELLCFRATLPADPDILYAGASTTATLTFWAEQVLGNP